jgi:hypothetical protein
MLDRILNGGFGGIVIGMVLAFSLLLLARAKGWIKPTSP